MELEVSGGLFKRLQSSQEPFFEVVYDPLDPGLVAPVGELPGSVLAVVFGLGLVVLGSWIARSTWREHYLPQPLPPKQGELPVDKFIAWIGPRTRWLEDAIVRARKQRPRWGPKKLRAVLLRSNPGAELPSVSTFASIFKRNGLVTPRRRRRRTPPSSTPLAAADRPNALWCIDFKGDFAVGRSRCYPLTITDAHSRYLLACVALPSKR